MVTVCVFPSKSSGTKPGLALASVTRSIASRMDGGTSWMSAVTHWPRTFSSSGPQKCGTP